MFGALPAELLYDILKEEAEHKEKLRKKFKAYIGYCFECGKERLVKKLQWDEDNGKCYCGTCFPKRRRLVKDKFKEEQRRKAKHGN